MTHKISLLNHLRTYNLFLKVFSPFIQFMSDFLNDFSGFSTPAIFSSHASRSAQKDFLFAVILVFLFNGTVSNTRLHKKKKMEEKLLFANQTQTLP